MQEAILNRGFIPDGPLQTPYICVLTGHGPLLEIGLLAACHYLPPFHSESGPARFLSLRLFALLYALPVWLYAVSFGDWPRDCLQCLGAKAAAQRKLLLVESRATAGEI